MRAHQDEGSVRLRLYGRCWDWVNAGGTEPQVVGCRSGGGGRGWGGQRGLRGGRRPVGAPVGAGGPAWHIFWLEQASAGTPPTPPGQTPWYLAGRAARAK